MFKIDSTDKKTDARTGLLVAGKQKIKTPFFMPVATKGAIKYLDFHELRKIGTDCIISNSLLLYLRPGLTLIEKAGGIHKFINWNRGIFTDSGGYQSLDSFFLKKTSDKGAYFKSPFDGKTEMITPEKSMKIQLTLGPNVAMCLDDVPKASDPINVVNDKTQRSHAWAERCKITHDKLKDEMKSKQLLFGIAQGGMNKTLRGKSISFINKLDFDGVAVGGLAIGESIDTMYNMIKTAVPLIPETKPRYLMGVGRPENILECISHGVDCFDSTFPTQNARHETLFTWNGKIKLNRQEYLTDLKPIDPKCDCFVCQNYSRAYIKHQLKMGEAVGKKLATYHNLYFMQKLIEKSRTAIMEGRFEKFKTEFLKMYCSKKLTIPKKI